jgi:hypothetical protein
MFALDAIHMVTTHVLLDRHEAMRAALGSDGLGPSSDQNVCLNGLSLLHHALDALFGGAEAILLDPSTAFVGALAQRCHRIQSSRQSVVVVAGQQESQGKSKWFRNKMKRTLSVHTSGMLPHQRVAGWQKCQSTPCSRGEGK